MFATNVFWLYVFIAVPEVISFTRMNTSGSAGKVIISGDRNNVVVSSAQESRVTLGDIKSGLDSVDNNNKEISRKLKDQQVLSSDTIRGNFNMMNRTIQALSRMIEKKNRMVSKKLHAFDKRILALGKIKGFLNETTQIVESTVNRSIAGLFVKIQTISQRLSALDRHGTYINIALSDYAVVRKGYQLSTIFPPCFAVNMPG